MSDRIIWKGLKIKTSSKGLAQVIAKLADSKKAENIALLDLTGYQGIADWFVICQGDNPAHNRAIAGAIIEGLKKEKHCAWHIEGHVEGRWIILDYSDVLAHIMLPELRDYYALEKLWPSIMHSTARKDGGND
jgi:ribosome-associated protein